MDRLEWLAKLAPLVRPRSPNGAADQLANYLQYLGAHPDRAFTDESLTWIATRLKRTPSLAELNAALLDYLRETAPKKPPPAWQKPQDEAPGSFAERMAREWDDPSGIRERIRLCNGELRFLRLLALIVGRHAPQHLGLLPPHVLRDVARDPKITLPVFAQIRREMEAEDAVAPAANVGSAPEGPGPRYLTPEQLDAVNPLPGGRKRAPDAPPAGPATTDRPQTPAEASASA